MYLELLELREHSSTLNKGLRKSLTDATLGCSRRTVRSDLCTIKSGAKAKYSSATYSPVEKENAAQMRTGRLSGPRKHRYRDADGCRLRINGGPLASDRWSALTKLVQKTINNHKGYSDSDSSDSSSDEDEEAEDQATTSSAAAFIDPFSPKYSSPLSPRLCGAREAPERLSYPHRGHSRSSLLHQKSFWHERREEWELWRNQDYLDEVYGGISPSSSEEVSSNASRPSLRSPPHRLSPIPSRENAAVQRLGQPSSLKPALFPRIGDLSGVRDPYMLNIDQWLGNFPLWTLRKMSWLFDADHRARTAETLKQEQQGNLSGSIDDSAPVTDERIASNHVGKGQDEEDIDDADVSVSSFLSAGDVTLVEPSGSPIQFIGSPSDDCISKRLDFVEVPLHVDDTVPSRPGHSTTPTVDKELSSSASDSILQWKVSEHDPRPWELSWYARWEILLQQIKSAEEFAATRNGACSTQMFTLHMQFYPFISSLAVEIEEGTEGEPACQILPVEDEEDDYGELVENPVFQVGTKVNSYATLAQLGTDAFEKPHQSTDIPLCPLDGRSEAPALESSFSDTSMGDLSGCPKHGSNRNPFLEESTSESWSESEARCNNNVSDLHLLAASGKTGTQRYSTDLVGMMDKSDDMPPQADAIDADADALSHALSDALEDNIWSAED